MDRAAALKKLNHWIIEVPIRVQEIPEGEFAERQRPDKWAKIEILGHLCDSALTNLQRFVRAQYEPEPYKVLKYAQNDWVELMNYRSLSTARVLELWVSLNGQAAHVIAGIPDDKLQVPCDNGGESAVTLEWLVVDYVEHLEHHLGQIFGEL
ncbi:DinB family protein [Cohnella endophytica]|uniref:DinB family protein n=1 Tax=Cohnella endophytica TaxID=2419778 RepID=A0A494XKA7_9BACL|nr:DinB family protein [Cohnella endophytica]RKP47983.1 DinB family protein [Cohnella endophytica]